MQWNKDSYCISTDQSLLDIDVIYQFVSNSYWAKGIPGETLSKALAHSLCFGLYEQETQIGFARVITDGATFAYLADVFIVEQHQGKGLSKWLMEVVMSHPQLQGLRRFMLATRDAHGLYEKFGFTAIAEPQILMQVHRPNIYQQD